MVQSLTETGILHATVHDTLFGVLSFNVRPPRLKILNTSIVNKEKQCLYIFSMHNSRPVAGEVCGEFRCDLCEREERAVQRHHAVRLQCALGADVPAGTHQKPKVRGRTPRRTGARQSVAGSERPSVASVCNRAIVLRGIASR